MVNNQIILIIIKFIELDENIDEKDIDAFESEYLTPNGKKIDGYPSIWMVKGTDVYDSLQNPYQSIKNLETLV